MFESWGSKMAVNGGNAQLVRPINLNNRNVKKLKSDWSGREIVVPSTWNCSDVSFRSCCREDRWLLEKIGNAGALERPETALATPSINHIFNQFKNEIQFGWNQPAALRLVRFVLAFVVDQWRVTSQGGWNPTPHPSLPLPQQPPPLLRLLLLLSETPAEINRAETYQTAVNYFIRFLFLPLLSLLLMLLMLLMMTNGGWFTGHKSAAIVWRRSNATRRLMKFPPWLWWRNHSVAQVGRGQCGHFYGHLRGHFYGHFYGHFQGHFHGVAPTECGRLSNWTAIDSCWLVDGWPSRDGATGAALTSPDQHHRFMSSNRNWKWSVGY